MNQRYYIVYIILWVIMAYWFYRVVSHNSNSAPLQEPFAAVGAATPGNFDTFEIGKPYYIIESFDTLLALTYDNERESVVMASYPVDNDLQQWIPVREGSEAQRSATINPYCRSAILVPGLQYEGNSFLLKNKAAPVYLNVYYDTTNRKIGYDVFKLYTLTRNNRIVDNLASPIFSDPVVDRARCTQLGTSSAPQALRPKCTSDGMKTDVIGKRCKEFKPRAPFMKAEVKSENEWHNLDCEGGRIMMGAWWFGAPWQRTKRVCSGGYPCGRYGSQQCGQTCTDVLDGYGNWWSQQLWPGGCDRADATIDCRWTGNGGDKAGPYPLAWWPTAARNACAGASKCSFQATSAEWHNNPTGRANTSEVHYKCEGAPTRECAKWEDITETYCNKCTLFTGNYNKLTCTDTTDNIAEVKKFRFVNNELELVDKLQNTNIPALNSASKQYVGLSSDDKLTLSGTNPSVFYFVPASARAQMHEQYRIKNQLMVDNNALNEVITRDVRGAA